MTRPILFLSDFGLQDEYVGVCHAVIARDAPEVRVIDLAHGIPPQDVLAGAMALVAAMPHIPPDTVVLAVVDPGVGTDRRGVALEAGETIMVGPDNGLLVPAATTLGGVRRAVAIDPERVARGPISATFHGRDVFSPTAARLAAGVRLEDVGREIDPTGLVRLEEPALDLVAGRIGAEVIGVDRFGNLRLNASPRDLEQAGAKKGTDMLLLTPGGRAAVRWVATFADVPDGGYGMVVDSAGRMAVVRNGASAADGLQLRRGDLVTLALEGDAVG
jgi:S-adenosylmethionine hydrolase